jgi:hypothetical protein
MANPESVASGQLSVKVKGRSLARHGGLVTTTIRTPGRGAEAPLYPTICGVVDEFIAYIGSMVGPPIEFYSCFISYSTRDQEFA